MSYAITSLKAFDGEVTASAQDGTYVYLGTNKGDVIRYTISGGTVTTLTNVGGKIVSMSLYSGLLYVGIDGGKLVSVATT